MRSTGITSRLAEDAGKILEYFGRDFIETKGQRPPHFMGYPGGANLVIPATFLRVDNPEEYQTKCPGSR
jgi:integrase